MWLYQLPSKNMCVLFIPFAIGALWNGHVLTSMEQQMTVHSERFNMIDIIYHVRWVQGMKHICFMKKDGVLQLELMFEISETWVGEGTMQHIVCLEQEAENNEFTQKNGIKSRICKYTMILWLDFLIPCCIKNFCRKIDIISVPGSENLHFMWYQWYDAPCYQVVPPVQLEWIGPRNKNRNKNIGNWKDFLP